MLPHSCPQSPSFLDHVVLKRGALEEAVTGCQKIDSLLEGGDKYLRKSLSLPWTRKLSESSSSSVLSVTLIIKLEGH